MNDSNKNSEKASSVEGKSTKVNSTQSTNTLNAKTLDNTNIKEAKANTNDIKVFGNGDMFKLLCKASSESQGWMKSTKAMEVKGVGCVVQVTTQQRQPSGGYAIDEAVTFVPGVRIVENKDENDIVIGRELVASSRAV